MDELVMNETREGVVIDGYISDVCKEIAKYFEHYNPAGYNTSIESIKVTFYHMHVEIKRWYSCD
jgi:hypothetical protein